MQFMTYQEALDAGVVTQFVSGQLATADTINGNEKASYDNDVALKSLMDNAIVTINSTISSLIDGSPTDADTLKKLNDKILAINIILTSNDFSLDTIQEVVNFIKNDATYIANLQLNKIDISAIVDNLLSINGSVPLSANQGQVLKALIDAMYTNNQIDSALSGKVSTVSGKSLSTNDFTNTYKGQLDNLNNSLILISSVTQGVSFTAVGNTAYILVVAGITVTLPTTPTTGMVVELMDGTGALNAITVTAGGTVLVDGLSSYTIDAPKFDYRFVYVNPTYGWKVFGF